MLRVGIFHSLRVWVWDIHLSVVTCYDVSNPIWFRLCHKSDKWCRRLEWNQSGFSNEEYIL